MNNGNIKNQIDQRLADLKGTGQDKDKRGRLIEAKAAQLALRDLTLAAEIANSVAVTAAVDTVQEPSMEDVLAVHQLYNAYLNAAYQMLVEEGEIPQPPVPTTPSTVTKDFIS